MKIKNHKLQITKNGFTLIELLVVIAILGILAALATVSFTGSQKQARDVRRKSDLRQYQTALEVWANKNNGMYPSWSTTLAWGSQLCNGSLSTVGITACPQDPKYNPVDGSYAYKYQSNGTGSGTASATQFVLWATLENSTNMYWVVCSNGSSGKISSSTSFTGGACPAGLQP